MPATAASQPNWGDDIDAYLGDSTSQPIFDLPARRHMLPSVMDGLVPTENLCVCPGAPDAECACIDEWTDAEHRLCLICSMYCYSTDEQGVQHLHVDTLGPSRTLPPTEVV